MMENLREYQKEIANLEYTSNLLRWELRINAPKKSQNDLINLISYYDEKIFKLKTSDEYGKILNDAIRSEDFNKLEDAEKRYIKNLVRHYKQSKKIPIAFYNEYQKLKNKANLVWERAKKNNDFNTFKPYLNEIIKMTKEYYTYINDSDRNLYDVMLNEYETGVKSELIDKLFEELKVGILPLIPKENMEVKQISKDYSDEELIKCAKYLLKYIGFDMDRGAIGIYPHGYTEKIGPNDIRIAIRNTDNPINFVSTIIHEGGHGIFEQNIKQNLSQYENTTIDNLYALHESQSRFYENIIGRNKNFWIPIYDDIKKLLSLDIDIDEFVKMLNTPECGPIRVNADELTYCMHIILRYEIEREIFNDSIKVDDVPEIWKKKMHDYLNVDIINDSEGLMQDVHWSEGNFGYFPSYLMGSIYDGMFLEAMEKDLGTINAILKEGRIKEITNYLISNIYENGGAYTSLEIIDKMCNKELSVEPLVNYFKNKYDNTLVKKRK
mgnify:FL=1